VAETGGITGTSARLMEEGADWVTFTSRSTVEHFHTRFDLPKLVKKFPQLKIASIGPETTKTIKALGLKPTVEAKEHTTEGLIEALLQSKH
jgi:uroporphyrinogen III methyltransferase/synthase